MRSQLLLHAGENTKICILSNRHRKECILHDGIYIQFQKIQTNLLMPRSTGVIFCAHMQGEELVTEKEMFFKFYFSSGFMGVYV